MRGTPFGRTGVVIAIVTLLTLLAVNPANAGAGHPTLPTAAPLRHIGSCPGPGFGAIGQLHTHLSGVALDGPSDAWAVGNYKGHSLIDHWNGGSWDRRPSASLGLSAILTDVEAISPRDAWVVGSDGAGHTLIGQLAPSGGWRLASSPDVGPLFDVTSSGSGDVWALGSGGLLHWDGAAWSIAPAPAASINSIVSISPNDAWSVGDGAFHWDGSAWTQVPVPGASSLSDVVASASDDVWALGGSTAVRWDGSSWQSLPGPEQFGLGTLAVAAPTNAWAFSTNGRYLVVQHWNGFSWDFSTRQGDGRVAASDALPGGTVMAVGDALHRRRSLGAGALVGSCPERADVSITQVRTPARVMIDGKLVFRLRVRNDGPADATHVIVTDTLPSTVTLRKINGRVPCTGTTTIVCSINIVRPGREARIGLVTTATELGKAPNAAVASPEEPDKNRPNNTVRSRTSIIPPQADVVTTIRGPGSITADTSFTYVVRVLNDGPRLATNIRLADTLPDNVILQSLEISQGNCDVAGTAIACVIMSLSPHRRARLTVEVVPFVPGTIKDRAHTVSDTADPNRSNNGDALITTVDPQSGTTYVAASDRSYDPASVAIGRGTTVQWNFLGPGSHTATDASGMGLFDSGLMGAKSYYRFRFVGAGTYPVTSTPDRGFDGQVVVPMQIEPGIGGTGTPFDVTWASDSAPAGYAYDVQIRTPDPASGFTDWRSGVANYTDTFLATNGPGTYTFRARLRNVSTGAASGWSPEVGITVAVLVFDTGFAPHAATIAQGTTVTWLLPDGDVQHHIVQDGTGLALFDSGLLAPGETFSFPFHAAGVYTVEDPISAYTSTIEVPMTATPPSGGTSDTFTLAWSDAPPPSGDAFDVQIKRPGDSSWSSYLTNVTETGTTFTPDAGAGTYSLRARLRGSGGATDWSPTASITVS